MTRAPRIFDHPAALLDHAPLDLGTTDWTLIDQDRIDAFAEVTGDHQWIHVDVARARAGPFGAPIAHGYLTVSLFALFMPQLMEVRGASMGINIGLDRLRFIAPVAAGKRIRAQGAILKAEEIKGAVQLTTRLSVEIEHEPKLACTADVLSRYVPG